MGEDHLAYNYPMMYSTKTRVYIYHPIELIERLSLLLGGGFF